VGDVDDRFAAALKMAASEVHPGETIARQVPGPHFGDPIMVDVLIPQESDSDGISVLICSLSSPQELEMRGGKHRHRIEFSAELVYSLEFPTGVRLTLKRDPTHDQPGHALIPQLARNVYKADKNAYKAFANGFLARVKSVENPAARTQAAT
jgi:hypothetical protein